jgi:hypothetical protein
MFWVHVGFGVSMVAVKVREKDTKRYRSFDWLMRNVKTFQCGTRLLQVAATGTTGSVAPG